MLAGVIPHRGGVGDTGRDNLGIFTGPDSRNAAEPHAADILGAILENDNAVVAAFHRVLGADEFALRVERQYGFVPNIDGHDVAVVVDRNPIGTVEGLSFDKGGNGAVLGDLVDALRLAGVGHINGSLLRDADAVQNRRALDLILVARLAGV